MIQMSETFCSTSFKVSHYFSQQDIKIRRGGRRGRRKNKVHRSTLCTLWLPRWCLQFIFTTAYSWSLNLLTINYLILFKAEMGCKMICCMDVHWVSCTISTGTRNIYGIDGKFICRDWMCSHIKMMCKLRKWSIWMVKVL